MVQVVRCGESSHYCLAGMKICIPHLAFLDMLLAPWGLGQPGESGILGPHFVFVDETSIFPPVARVEWSSLKFLSSWAVTFLVLWLERAYFAWAPFFLFLLAFPVIGFSSAYSGMQKKTKGNH